MGTHGLGVMCAACKEVLVPDDCCKGEPHGYSYQQANEWAARAWPEHACFTATKGDGERGE